MDLVHQDGERLFVTSLDISNRFGKQHKDVLRAIDNLDCSDGFRRRNFAPTFYSRPNPKGGKGIPAPMFEITKEGFSFLCMGFTGPQAATWKERYIEAFAMMEATLRQPSALTHPAPQQLALAQEVGFLKDQLLATQQAMLGLYEKLDVSHGKHIRALGVLARQREAQAKRESVEAVIRLEREGVARDEIARLTGKTLNCVRQHIFRARADGRLPPAPDDGRRDADGRFKAQGALFPHPQPLSPGERGADGGCAERQPGGAA